MHTVEKLDPTDFVYWSDGDLVSRDELLPQMTPDQRVGVVMDHGTDGIGAGNFVLSSVLAFYEAVAESREDFYEYPDYYTFQTTPHPADYRMLDVYPDHKNVGVEPDAERLLRAINDRAITVLLVPAGPTRSPEIDEITRRSAQRRIDRCYLYAPDGRPGDADFAIEQPRDPAAAWYETTANSVETVLETYTLPSFGPSDTRVSQQFREIALEKALSRLPPGTNF
jgi:hypothetical protein